MKEIGKKEITWTVQNVQDFKTLEQTAVSPKFSICDDLDSKDTFHLEMIAEPPFCIINSDRVYWGSFYLVKDQPGSVNIKAKTDFGSTSGLGKVFVISEQDKQFLNSLTFEDENDLSIKVELTIIKAISE